MINTSPTSVITVWVREARNVPDPSRSGWRSGSASKANTRSTGASMVRETWICCTSFIPLDATGFGRANDRKAGGPIDRDSRTYEADWATANAEAPRRRATRVRVRQYLGVDRVRTRHESIRAGRPTDNHLSGATRTTGRTPRLTWSISACAARTCNGAPTPSRPANTCSARSPWL